MKKILLILTVVTLFSCQKQRETYLIKGNIKDVPDSAIIDLYVQYDNLGMRISSDTIISGQFEFSDTLEIRPSKMSLMMRDRDNFLGSCNLWVDHEVIEITGTGKYLSSWIASGNNKELNALNTLENSTRHLSVLTDSLYRIVSNNYENRELSEKTLKSIDSIGQIRREIQFGLIQENPNSQSAMEMLYNIARFDTIISKNSIKDVYESMDSSYQNSLLGEGILTVLEDKTIPNIGDQMVDFIAFDTKGQQHSLSEYKGKYILLDFWSLACGPCIMAIPETRELHIKNNDILTVVGVSMDTNEDLWRETSEKDSITWVNLSDGKGTFAGVSADYGIDAFPTYFLIDPQGVILEKWMGYRPNIFYDKLGQHIDGLKNQISKMN